MDHEAWLVIYAFFTLNLVIFNLSHAQRRNTMQIGIKLTILKCSETSIVNFMPICMVFRRCAWDRLKITKMRLIWFRQERLVVASIARDDLSTLPGDDPFPRARMHRDRNAR